MSVLGTKCICDECSVQVVVIKDGVGDLMCHGLPLRVVAGASTAGDGRRSVADSGGGDDDVEYF